jgi:hypothetical protein
MLDITTVPAWAKTLLREAQSACDLEQLPTPDSPFMQMHLLAFEGERNRRMQETQFQFDIERAFRHSQADKWR